jgi:hypothetical protein
LADACGRLAAEALPQFLADRISATPQAGPTQYVRRLPPGALQIDERVDERRARWLAGSLGRITPLCVESPHGLTKIGPVVAVRGKPSGAPPVVGPRCVECDVADARLSFRRWTRLRRGVERMSELAAMARRPLAA